MWQPDGAGSRARIGVLTPHLDPVPESEFQALAPDGVSIHAARVPLGMVGPDGEIIPRIDPDIARAFSQPPAVDHAAALLSALAPSAVVYAFTSSSYLLGPEGDALGTKGTKSCNQGRSLDHDRDTANSFLKPCFQQRIGFRS